jgi:hypothetical protein
LPARLLLLLLPLLLRLLLLRLLLLLTPPRARPRDLASRLQASYGRAGTPRPRAPRLAAASCRR